MWGGGGGLFLCSAGFGQLHQQTRCGQIPCRTAIHVEASDRKKGGGGGSASVSLCTSGFEAAPTRTTSDGVFRGGGGTKAPMTGPWEAEPLQPAPAGAFQTPAMPVSGEEMPRVPQHLGGLQPLVSIGSCSEGRCRVGRSTRTWRCVQPDFQAAVPAAVGHVSRAISLRGWRTWFVVALKI